MSHNLRPLLAVGVLITRMEVMRALGSDEEAQKAELVTAGAIYALSHALSGEALSEFLLQMEIGPIRVQEARRWEKLIAAEHGRMLKKGAK